MGHHSEASCEEFIEGLELTYETICHEGRPLYESVCYYLPNALVARQNERTPLHAGDPVSVELDPSVLHFFNREGKTLAATA